MKYILTYQEDQEHGVLGFRIEGSTLDSENYNMATSGDLIAHDIIEHSTVEGIGSLADELRAMGAIWYVRGQNGMLGYGTPSIATQYQHVASDIMRMGRDFMYGEEFGERVPNKRTCGHIDDLRDCISQAQEDFREELDDDERTDRETLERMTTYWQGAIKFMIQGYQHAKRRYSRVGGSDAALRLFRNISDVVDKALTWAECEGQQFELSVEFSTATASCSEYYPAEEYY